VIVNIKEGPFSESEACDVMETIYIAFHPAGYGTSLDVYEDSEGWWVKGFRSSTCD